MFDWLLGTRSKRLRDKPSETEDRLFRMSLWQGRYLDPPTVDRLIRWCRVFIAEKNWEGCGGQTIDPRVQWSVAAPASLMVASYRDWYFDATETVLVYPAPYVATQNGRTSSLTNTGTQVMGEFARAGETSYRGPVIVNWHDTIPATQHYNAGHHIVIHELAHQLDLINSPQADGLPPLPDTVIESQWQQSMTAEFQAAREMVANGYRVLINDYGLSQQSEFFAVASEYFFQMPNELSRLHPNVFQLLLQFYGTDLSKLIPETPLL
jgi:MtfA peptidase